jgi:septum formation protein
MDSHLMSFGNVLYLASGSGARQYLLRQAKISFVILEHTVDEHSIPWSGSLEGIVHKLALLKMEHVCMPEGTEDNEVCYVLTADTLVQDKQGNIHGKPANKEDAIAKIRVLREGAVISTSFCLDKKRWVDTKWELEQRICQAVTGECICDVPDDWIPRYLENTQALKAAGALVVEGYGSLFVKSIDGSPSSIMGLPLAELRKALDELGFFAHL